MMVSPKEAQRIMTNEKASEKAAELKEEEKRKNRSGKKESRLIKKESFWTRQLR